MESRLPAWTAAVERLDAALEAIATRPVALSELASLGERYRELNPLDEAGVRDAASALLTEILDAYPRLNCAERIALRALFDQHRSLGWAAGFLLPTAMFADTPTLRRQLLLFSLLDQGPDARDARLWLRSLCRRPGVDCAALPELLREVAALSSAIDRYHMGSTASMLAAAASELQHQ
jgi:hypothetical protein